jgi:hypothetical protein
MMEPTCSAFYYRCVCVCKTCGFHKELVGYGAAKKRKFPDIGYSGGIPEKVLII